MSKPVNTLMLHCIEQSVFAPNAQVSVVLLAKPLHDGMEKVLCNFGSFNSECEVKYLHEMPASMKRMLRKQS